MFISFPFNYKNFADVKTDGSYAFKKCILGKYIIGLYAVFSLNYSFQLQSKSWGYIFSFTVSYMLNFRRLYFLIIDNCLIFSIILRNRSICQKYIGILV